MGGGGSVPRRMKIQSKCTEHQCRKCFQLNCAGYCQRERTNIFKFSKKITLKFEQEKRPKPTLKFEQETMPKTTFKFEQDKGQKPSQNLSKKKDRKPHLNLSKKRPKKTHPNLNKKKAKNASQNLSRLFYFESPSHITHSLQHSLLALIMVEEMKPSINVLNDSCSKYLVSNRIFKL